jgi:alkylated DNA nucleotide flippase Atl1
MPERHQVPHGQVRTFAQIGADTGNARVVASILQQDAAHAARR